MRSLKFEQVAVIKFLTLEGSNKKEIYTRLKNIFSNFTLPQKKVTKLYFRFLKEGLLGLKEELVYEDEIIRNPRSTPDPPSDSPCIDEDGQSSDGSYMPKSQKFNIKIENSNFSNDGKLSKDLNSEEIFSIEESEMEDSNVITVSCEPEVNIIELSNSNLIENNSENGLYDEEKFEFYTSVDNEVFEDADNLLPIMPALNATDSIKYLERLHPDFSCLLCEERQFPFRSHLKVHLSFHVKHSAILFNNRSLLCKKNCLSTNRGHYHCSLCPMISPHLSRVKHHFKKVHNNMAASRNAGKRNSERCICVDPAEGIYLVLKSKYGVAEPVHVQKCSFDDQGSRYSRCSQEICEKAMETARLNGNYDLECKHLKEVKMHSRFKPYSFSLTRNALRGIGRNEEEVAKCLSLSEMARAKSVALVVEWVASDECIYFSVFCNDSFASMDRTLVALHTKDNVYICSCPKQEHFCLYVKVSEVYYLNRFMESESQDSLLNKIIE